MPILGKTNMDEFAMGSSTEHSAYGPTRNPWDLDRIPGGSGGGSAAAVAAFEAPLAIGTDTGGSIRQPGAVTGTVGVKPTYGGVSRYGLVALASSASTRPARCTRTVLDAALLHEVIGGHDPLDSTSHRRAGARRSSRRPRRGDVTGMRIGVVKELGGEGYQAGVRPRFEESVELLVEAGAEVVEVSCPNFELRARGVLPDPAERGVAATSPSSTPCATACGCCPTASTTRAPSRSWRPPATPASATRSSAGSSSARTRCPAATTTPTTARRRRCAR